MNKQDLKIWISDNKSKFCALVVSFIYIVIALFMSGTIGLIQNGILAFVEGVIAVILMTSFLLIFPLGLIFFCKTLSHSFKGWTDGFLVTNQDTPACLLAFVGWLLLLIPIILMIWHWLFK